MTIQSRICTPIEFERDGKRFGAGATFSPAVLRGTEAKTGLFSQHLGISHDLTAVSAMPESRP